MKEPPARGKGRKNFKRCVFTVYSGARNGNFESGLLFLFGPTEGRAKFPGHKFPLLLLTLEQRGQVCGGKWGVWLLGAVEGPCRKASFRDSDSQRACCAVGDCAFFFIW